MTTQIAPLSFDDLDDSSVVRSVSERLSVPREQEADSFVLHSPLELLARSALLPFVRPAARPAARARIADVAQGYERYAPLEAVPPRSFSGVVEAATSLRAALAGGELDDVDVAARFLGAHARGSELVPLLADDVIPALAAAAHASIYLFQLRRVGPRDVFGASLLRPLARELARHPTWRLSWVDEVDEARGPHGPSLFEALGGVPGLGLPGSDFIYPLVHRVDEGGFAARALGSAVRGAELSRGAVELMRVAALSMLLEPLDYAPYGFSHALTLPQAVLGIASKSSRPRRALAVAATHVLAFRAAMATVPLSESYAPEQTHLGVEEALREAPHLTPAALFQLPDAELARGFGVVASYAAQHPDAHLVKYTLACLDAALDDPGARRLYFTAAAKLAGYWQVRAPVRFMS